MGFMMDGLDAEAVRPHVFRPPADRAHRAATSARSARMMLLVAAMIVLDSLADTVLPLLLARGIDILTHSHTHARRLPGWWRRSWSRACSRGCFNFVRQWYTAQAVGDVVLQLRQDAFSAVLARDMSFYDEYPSGKIVSRVTSDTEDFATVVTLTLNLLSQVLLVVLIAVVLFIINRRWRC